MRLCLLIAMGLALAPAASAEPQPEWTHWDDSHMQSNFARQRGPAPPRPPVQGTDRYHQVIEDAAPTPPTGVAETTLHLSQHEWRRGNPAGVRTGAPLLGSSSSLGSGRPTASSGLRGSTTQNRSSGLRSSSLGGQRQRR
jgi:hypothetical protein